MSIKTIIAAATLVTALAGPALAGDQDLQALEVSSGRLLPQSTIAPNVYAGSFGAYASSARAVRSYSNHGYNGSASREGDFQLWGR